MRRDLTTGPVTRTMLLFALPMILGNVLQQCYNLADTWIVGEFLGTGALGAVGSAYTLMTFLTSLIIGMCMGAGALFSISYGQKDHVRMREYLASAFALILVITAVLTAASYGLLHTILRWMQTPEEVYDLMFAYVYVILAGLPFIFLYNYFAFFLRAVGNSVVPLFFLGISTVLNIGLDILFVTVLQRGVAGAAEATVIAQVTAGLGIMIYSFAREPLIRPDKGLRIGWKSLFAILTYSATTGAQQSVMNFGILMVQGLVNSFGASVMAAFAAGVKIDTLAYMPAQEFGNAYSIFISQNYGAGNMRRIRAGTRSAVILVLCFCAVISGLVWLLAPQLISIFIQAHETQALAAGVQYLRIEGACYVGIGILFLLYGYFRAVERPRISLLLTVISLGTRVLLAYSFAPRLGVQAIWWAIPIGWVLADITGAVLKKADSKYLENQTLNEKDTA
jgi:putative MATE family efflux protein